LPSEKSQNYWRKGKCRLEAHGCHWKRMSDANTFRERSFKRSGFFSILLTKGLSLNETVAAAEVSDP
jgi:hypothetical protein